VTLTNSSSRHLTGATLILTGLFLLVGALALQSWGSRTVVTSSGAAPPLTAAERAALVRDGSTISSLPLALGEVTQAMADAARSKSGSPLTTTRAGELLFEQPELTPLLHAVEHPAAVADSLKRGLRPARGTAHVESLLDVLWCFVLPGVITVVLGVALRSRRFWARARGLAPILSVVIGTVVLAGVFAPIDSGSTLWSSATHGPLASSSQVNPSVFEVDLSQLEAVYDDIVPALQYAGATGRQVLDPESAVQVLADYRQLDALDRFVTDFSALYGVGVLITQEAAGLSEAPNGSQAMHWLGWIGLLAGLALLLVGLAGLVSRRREALAPSAADDDSHVVSAGMVGTTT
jgi:protein-S-isoprenylcysteine O-methyltransferase Ste14